MLMVVKAGIPLLAGLLTCLVPFADAIFASASTNQLFDCITTGCGCQLGVESPSYSWQAGCGTALEVNEAEECAPPRVFLPDLPAFLNSTADDGTSWNPLTHVSIGKLPRVYTIVMMDTTKFPDPAENPDLQSQEDTNIGMEVSTAKHKARIKWLVVNIPGTQLQSADSHFNNAARNCTEVSSEPVWSNFISRTARLPSRQCKCYGTQWDAGTGNATTKTRCFAKVQEHDYYNPKVPESTTTRFCQDQAVQQTCASKNVLCDWETRGECSSQSDGVSSCIRTVWSYEPPLFLGPEKSLLHREMCNRFVLLLLRQREPITLEPQLPEREITLSRTNFNISTFVQKYKMQVVAANFIRAGAPPEAIAGQPLPKHPCAEQPRCIPPDDMGDEGQAFSAAFAFKEGDPLSMALGFILGPFFFLYGAHFPAVLILFNALWAVGLESFLVDITQYGCIEYIQPDTLVKLYGLLIAGGCMAFAGLKRGAFDKGIKVGIIVKQLGGGINLVLRPALTRGESWALALNPFTTLACTWFATRLAVGTFPATVTAVTIATLRATLQDVFNKANEEIDCSLFKSVNDYKAHMICNMTTSDAATCSVKAFAEFGMNNLPVVLPAMVVMLVLKSAEWQASREEKETKGCCARCFACVCRPLQRCVLCLALWLASLPGRAIVRLKACAGLEEPEKIEPPFVPGRQTNLITFNAAMVGSGLIGTGICGLFAGPIAKAGLRLDAMGFYVQMLLVGVSQWQSRMQENFDAKVQIAPRALTPIISILAIFRLNCLVPLDKLNNKLFAAAGAPLQTKNEQKSSAHELDAMAEVVDEIEPVNPVSVQPQQDKKQQLKRSTQVAEMSSPKVGSMVL